MKNWKSPFVIGSLCALFACGETKKAAPLTTNELKISDSDRLKAIQANIWTQLSSDVVLMSEDASVLRLAALNGESNYCFGLGHLFGKAAMIANQIAKVSGDLDLSDEARSRLMVAASMIERVEIRA